MSNLPDRYDPDLPDEEEVDPRDLVSERSRGVALGLGIVLGVFGGHRFYVGKIGTGLAMLFTFGGLGLWWLYDIILVSAGEFTDIDGKRLVRWDVNDPIGRTLPRGATRQIETLTQDVDALRTQLGDLAERVDFAERMLAQQRERNSLKP
ncbi:MAG TPA: NINE protein [Gemmatimonadales bacterium]|nr:NINE protein [Gemmatimonadales bacterium]